MNSRMNRCGRRTWRNYFGLPQVLSARGVVGLNSRNGHVILPLNERRLYPLVDDKVQTKRLAIAAGLPVPPLYGLIEYPAQVRDLAAIVKPYPAFVIKPAQGAGGDGIIVIKERVGEQYKKAGGDLVSIAELEFHVHNALGGVFSLGGQPDSVLIEYCIQFDPVFDGIALGGVPDIRVIVFYGVPVMAMVRLPTRMSDGRANLHQGAIGAGVDMSNGQTLDAVWLNQIVSEHPDTRKKVRGINIAGWQQILSMSAQAYDLTGLVYQGVDIVLDRDLGPLILELNARPGLNIQIANQCGLQPRLDAVIDALDCLESISDRVAFAQRQFAPNH